MAYRERQKISQMTPKGADLASTDLIEVSTLVSGSYVTKSMTGDELVLNNLSGYVPYTGATQDVDLDTNKISARSVYIEGTNGDGHLHLKHQNADATATGQSTALYADSNGDLKYKNDNDYYTTLKTSSNNANRVYTFPDFDCTLAMREIPIVSYNINYELVLFDNGWLIEMNKATPIQLQIPTNANEPFPIGAQILVSQLGVGQVTIVGDTGVTIRSSGGKTKTAAQYAIATLIKRGTNEWYLAGDLTT
jgi:hypothetical protein